MCFLIFYTPYFYCLVQCNLSSALLNNAARILIYHNHPSGNTDPSIEDYELTDRFFAAGELLAIEVLDHADCKIKRDK